MRNHCPSENVGLVGGGLAGGLGALLDPPLANEPAEIIVVYADRSKTFDLHGEVPDVSPRIQGVLPALSNCCMARRSLSENCNSAAMADLQG